VLELADRVGVAVPITEGVVGVCHRGVRARDLVPELMGREMKAEHAP
jgi:glycerol-3-phosphate dehydrogenase (NAD(P)+)